MTKYFLILQESDNFPEKRPSRCRSRGRHYYLYPPESTFITILRRTAPALGKWFSHFPKIAGVLYFMIVIYGETFITNACNVSIRFLLPPNYLMEFLFCDKYR